MASWEEFSRIVAEAKAAKKLDPVGHEDDDVDNDGDSDSSDSYLKKRRATVGAAIAADKKKKVEEALDPVGKEDKDIDNDGDHDKSDSYLLNRRKVRAKIIPPQERLKTDRDMFNIPKSEQEAARERTLAKAKAKREKMKEEFVEEDKEYRREMAKAAARERAEERKAETEFRSRGRSSEKKKGPKLSTTPEAKSVVKNYVDQEMGKIKYMDKLTKKNKNPIGLVTKEEYIEEKALSRAQQRFMGMVYAAKKGGTPASPEVAKAAEGMTKKAARDFAKTKHEGLPEKKEETKEEVSLVQKVISEFSPLSEGKLDDLLADIRGEDDNKKKSQSPSPKSEKERKEEAKKQVKRGKSDPSALTRRAAVAGAARLKAEQEKTKRQRERQQYEKERRLDSESRREEKDRKKALQKAETEKQKELKQKERDKIEAEEAKKRTKQSQRKELVQNVRSAWSGSTKVGSGKKDTSDMSATVSNLGNIVGGVAKTGIALGKYAFKRAQSKREEKKQEKENQNEQFSNWREEFIFEVDDLSVQNEKQKVIDVTKKKNKIEINPNMSEACGCEDEEKMQEKPKKDMRELPTKVNLLKTKARAMGARNPIVMVASEETDNIQEIAPLLAVVARVAAPAVARGVTSRVAGSAAQGSLRARAAEIIGKKAGEKMQNMFAGQPTQNKQTSSSNDEVQKPLGGIFAPEEFQREDWQSVNRKDNTDGLSQKAVNAYRRENPGSKLQTAVTEKKPTGKRAERRKSFCRRMNGMKDKLTSAETSRDPDSRINKALRRWNCN